MNTTLDSQMTLASHPIDRSRVICVYSGKQGCMCGCRGIYRYAEAMRAEANRVRYKIRNDEVNESMVTRIVNKVRASPNVDVRTCGPDKFIYLVDDKETDRIMAVFVLLARADAAP